MFIVHVCFIVSLLFFLFNDSIYLINQKVKYKLSDYKYHLINILIILLFNFTVACDKLSLVSLNEEKQINSIFISSQLTYFYLLFGLLVGSNID